MMSPWQHPLYIQRVWCVFEFSHAIMENKVGSGFAARVSLGFVRMSEYGFRWWLASLELCIQFFLQMAFTVLVLDVCRPASPDIGDRSFQCWCLQTKPRILLQFSFLFVSSNFWVSQWLTKHMLVKCLSIFCRFGGLWRKEFDSLVSWLLLVPWIETRFCPQARLPCSPHLFVLILAPDNASVCIVSRCLPVLIEALIYQFCWCSGLHPFASWKVSAFPHMSPHTCSALLAL